MSNGHAYRWAGGPRTVARAARLDDHGHDRVLVHAAALLVHAHDLVETHAADEVAADEDEVTGDDAVRVDVAHRVAGRERLLRGHDRHDLEA
jgi:hypothetical protein